MADALVTPALAADWIQRLQKLWSSIRKVREQELTEIRNIFGDPESLAKLYVEPDCQHINPADHDEDEPGRAIRQPVREWLNQFLRGSFFERDGRNMVFILSDAGMGKTSLLMMLKLTHLLRFWPDGLDFKLLKLGPETLDAVAAIQNHSRTVLLLDALDEDSSAWGRIEERLVELLDATKSFRQIILTCRTQFFPEGEAGPIEKLGKVEVGGFICNLLYLSSFTDAQVETYLCKVYPSSWLDRLKKLVSKKDNPRLLRARRLVGPMKSLRMRPMLLAHIEELAQADIEDWGEFPVYKALVRHWLLREERKQRGRFKEEELWEVCETVALYLQSSGKRVLSSADLKRLIDENPSTGQIEAFDVGGRSLLNRTSDGSFRFSHYSVQEFFVAHWLTTRPTSRAVESLYATDQLVSFLFSQIARENPAEQLVRIPWRALEFRDVKVDLSEFKFSYIQLEGVSLDGIYLRGANFRDARFDGSTLRGAILENSWLWNASLARCDLRRANLAGADLHGATLKEIDARGAVFRGADLTAADLSFGRFVDADFRDARLDDLQASGAGFLRAQGLNDRIMPGSGSPDPAELRIVLQVGHTAAIRCIAWDADLRTIATGADDGTIRLWKLQGEVLAALVSSGGAVQKVAWGSRKRRLASVSEGGVVEIWDVESLRSLHMIRSKDRLGTEGLEWSTDDQQLAVLWRSGVVEIWDVGDQLLRNQTFRVSEIWPQQAALHLAQGYVAAVQGGGSEIDIYTIGSGRLRRLPGKYGELTSLVFNPQGSLLASGHNNGAICIWDLAGGVLAHAMDLKRAAVRELSWSPDGAGLACGREDGAVEIWDVAAGQVAATLHSHSNAVSALALGPGNYPLLSGSWDGILKSYGLSLRVADRENETYGLVWARIEPGTAKADRLLHAFVVPRHFGSHHSGGGTRIAYRNGKFLDILNLRTNVVDQIDNIHDRWISSTAWTEDGKLLACGFWDGTTTVWSPETGRLRSAKAHDKKVSALAWSRDGELLATGSDDKLIKIWRAEDGHPLLELEPEKEVTALAWDSERSRLASCSWSDIRIWDAENGKPLRRIEAGFSSTSLLAWKPNSNCVAIGRDDGVVLWDLDGGEPRRLHRAGIPCALAWTPDGDRLEIATQAGWLDIWDLAEDEPRRIARFYEMPGARGVIETYDGFVDGPREALEALRFGDGWALYELEDVPERHDPDRVRQVLRPRDRDAGREAQDPEPPAGG